MDTKLPRAIDAPPPGRLIARAAAALLTGLALACAAFGANAQGGHGLAHPGSAFAPAGAFAAPRLDLVSQLAALREQRLRPALERIEPAPRVQAVVQALLPADVQVVVVHNAPGGLGSYYPGLSITGYDHVYSNKRQRGVHSGARGLIVLDARLEAQGEPEVIAFVLAHEYGHHRLGRDHTEQDADAFARQMLTPLGLWLPAAVARAFDLAMGLPQARLQVPTVAERLHALEQSGTRTVMAGRQP